MPRSEITIIGIAIAACICRLTDHAAVQLELVHGCRAHINACENVPKN